MRHKCMCCIVCMKKCMEVMVMGRYCKVHMQQRQDMVCSIVHKSFPGPGI